MSSSREPVSKAMYEIVDGKFVFRGWDIVNGHMPDSHPEKVVFGRTGITLRLVKGKPKLDVPRGQKAELQTQDHAFDDRDRRIEGQFLEVRIY